MPLLLIVLGISAIYLYVDFRTDPGEHLKAKTIHTVLIVFLFYYYIDSIRELIAIVGDIEVFFRQRPSLGIIPGLLNAVITLMSSIISAIVLWNVGKMVRRHNSARKLIIKLLPVLAFFSLFSFYEVLAIGGNVVGFYEWGIILSGFIIMMGLFLGIMFIYRAPFMVRFFERASPNAPLTDLIDRIGEDEAGE